MGARRPIRAEADTRGDRYAWDGRVARVRAAAPNAKASAGRISRPALLRALCYGVLCLCRLLLDGSLGEPSFRLCTRLEVLLAHGEAQDE